MVRAGRSSSCASRRERNRSARGFRRSRPARNAAHLLESGSRSPSLPVNNDPQYLQPNPGNPCPEGAHPRLPSATVPQARFRAPLNTVLFFLQSARGAAHAPIPTTPLLPVSYTPFCNFPYARGFHEWSKDLRGSPDAIPIVLILKAAISKVLRLTRHLSRYWSLLRFSRARPARC